MKKALIFLILFAFALYGCDQGSSNSSSRIESDSTPIIDTTTDVSSDATTDTDTTTDTTEPEETTGPPRSVAPPETDPVIVQDQTTDATGDSEWNPNLAIITTSEALLSDGNEIRTLVSGQVKYVAERLLSVANELIDYNGIPEVKYTFDQVPAQVLDNGSVYHCIEYDPDTALSMGAQPRWYSEFFKDGVSLGDWFMNQMRCADLVGVGDIVWAIDENGSPVAIDGLASDVEYIHDGEFYIHSRDIVNKLVSFNDLQAQDYQYNYLFAAGQWQIFEGLWYSENGYTWSETAGLSENVNTLWNWNEQPFPIEHDIGQYPTLIAAGVHEKLYWIEANTGWLFSFDTGQDQIEMVNRLYLGDGQKSTGTGKDLQPVMVWPYLYYFDSGWYRLNVETGFTSLFYAGSAEIYGW